MFSSIEEQRQGGKGRQAFSSKISQATHFHKESRPGDHKSDSTYSLQEADTIGYWDLGKKTEPHSVS